MNDKQFCKLCSNIIKRYPIAHGSCGHNFHIHCIENWVENNLGKCPYINCKFIWSYKTHPYKQCIKNLGTLCYETIHEQCTDVNMNNYEYLFKFYNN